MLIRLLILLVILITMAVISNYSLYVEDYNATYINVKKYTTQLTIHPDHELMPDFDMDTVENPIDNCFGDDRVIEMNFGKAGFTDRSGKIVLMAGIACHLRAKILVPEPCEALAESHNNRKKTTCDKTWGDYVEFPVYKREGLCRDSILVGGRRRVPGMVEKIKTITPAMLISKYNSDRAPFHWILQMSEYKLADLWKMTNRTLPHECKAARAYGKNVVASSKKIIKDSFGNKPFMSLKIRRGDDVERTKRCSEPSLINRFFGKLGFSNSSVFVMMEPDENYKDSLIRTMNSTLIFEPELVHNENNYDRYIHAYYIHEHAPMGRVEIRRLETTDPNYSNPTRTCSLRYFPPQDSKFLSSGFSPKFVDYYELLSSET